VKTQSILQISLLIGKGSRKPPRFAGCHARMNKATQSNTLPTVLVGSLESASTSLIPKPIARVQWSRVVTVRGEKGSLERDWTFVFSEFVRVRHLGDGLLKSEGMTARRIIPDGWFCPLRVLCCVSLCIAMR
jgi:hypothetical protein